MNLCTLSRRPRAEGRNKCSNFGPNGSRRDDRPFSIANNNNNNNNNYGTQHTANNNNRPSMHPFKGLKGGRSGLTSGCRNSFDSDDPELEEIEFNKRDPGPGFQSFSDDIDLNLDLEVEPIYSEPEFKNEQFDFHIYDLLSVRGGSYRCLQTEKQQGGENSQHQQCSERLRQAANIEKSSEQGKQYCQVQGGERLWGGGGQPQKSHHWSQLGLLSDPQVSQWCQLGAGQLSSDSDYASYDASVSTPANGRGEPCSNSFYWLHSAHYNV